MTGPIGSRVTAGWTRQELAELSDRELLGIVSSLPAESDLTASLGVSGHDLRNAQLAEMAFEPSSLDAPTSSQPGAAMSADLLGAEDPRMEHVLDMQAVATHWPELPPLEQKILLMRFYGSMTQDQIGRHLGISQMQVSRLLSHALGYLRPRLLGLDKATAR
jgi:RNA polymerase sigma-B factor